MAEPIPEETRQSAGEVPQPVLEVYRQTFMNGFELGVREGYAAATVDLRQQLIRADIDGYERGRKAEREWTERARSISSPAAGSVLSNPLVWLGGIGVLAGFVIGRGKLTSGEWEPVEDEVPA